MVILVLFPKLAKIISKAGIDFVSKEFHFFSDVVTHTIQHREMSQFRRGDFLDIMRETNRKLMFFE